MLPIYTKEDDSFIQFQRDNNEKLFSVSDEIVNPFINYSMGVNTFGTNEYQLVNWSFIEDNIVYTLYDDDVNVTENLIINFEDYFFHRKFSYEFQAYTKGLYTFNLTFNSHAISIVENPNYEVVFVYDTGNISYNYSDIVALELDFLDVEIVGNTFKLNVNHYIKNKNTYWSWDPAFGSSVTGSNAALTSSLGSGRHYYQADYGSPDFDGFADSITVYFTSMATDLDVQCALYEYVSATNAGNVIMWSEKKTILSTDDNTWFNFKLNSPTPVNDANNYFMLIYATECLDAANSIGINPVGSGDAIYDYNACPYSNITDSPLTGETTSSYDRAIFCNYYANNSYPNMVVDGYLYEQDNDYPTCHDDSTADTVNNDSVIWVGQAEQLGTDKIWRGYLYFDTSSIPDSATIDDATVHVMVDDDADAENNDMFFQYDDAFTYPSHPLVAGDYLYTHYDDNTCGVLDGSVSEDVWYEVTISDLSCINKQGLTKFCIRSDEDVFDNTSSSGTFVLKFYDSLSFYNPYIRVNYTEVSAENWQQVFTNTFSFSNDSVSNRQTWLNTFSFSNDSVSNRQTWLNQFSFSNTTLSQQTWLNQFSFSNTTTNIQIWLNQFSFSNDSVSNRQTWLNTFSFSNDSVSNRQTWVNLFSFSNTTDDVQIWLNTFSFSNDSISNRQIFLNVFSFSNSTSQHQTWLNQFSFSNTTLSQQTWLNVFSFSNTSDEYIHQLYAVRFSFSNTTVSNQLWINTFSFSNDSISDRQTFLNVFSFSNDSVSNRQTWLNTFSFSNTTTNIQIWLNQFSFSNSTSPIEWQQTWLNQFSFSNSSIAAITISNVYPSNHSININLQPFMYATFNSSTGRLMNVSWYYGSSQGNENNLLETDTTFSNSTQNALNFNATIRADMNYWRIHVNDGITHENYTYSFRTEPYSGGQVAPQNNNIILGLAAGALIIALYAVLKRRRKKRNA